MNLLDIFTQAKTGTLPSGKAVYVTKSPGLPESKALTNPQLIELLGMQEVTLADGLIAGSEDIFLGSTAYLADGMSICDSFEEFVINVSGW